MISTIPVPIHRSTMQSSATLLALVVLGALAYPLAGCKSNHNSPTSPATSADFSFLNGTWTGTWTDTRYNVTGSLQATFTVNGANVSAIGVIGLQSLGLGGESGNGSGTVSGDTLNFTFSAATVGSGAGTLKVSGAGTGNGTVTGALNFGAFTFQGTGDASKIEGTFNFTSPTGGNGVATLTKQ